MALSKQRGVAALFADRDGRDRHSTHPCHKPDPRTLLEAGPLARRAAESAPSQTAPHNGVR